MVIEDLVSPNRSPSELPAQREARVNLPLWQKFRTEFWKHARVQLMTQVESLVRYGMSDEIIFTLRMLSLQYSQFQILRNQLC